MEKKVILVRAPPFNVNNSNSRIVWRFVQIIGYTISFIWGNSTEVDNCYEYGQCRRIKTVLILDEAQLIYKEETEMIKKNSGNSGGSLKVVFKNYRIMFAT